MVGKVVEHDDDFFAIDWRQPSECGHSPRRTLGGFGNETQAKSIQPIITRWLAEHGVTSNNG
jgi:hypothetical protein